MVVEPQEMAVKTTLREKTGGTRQLVSRYSYFIIDVIKYIVHIDILD